MKTREPVVLVMSVLAGLQFLFGGAAGITALSGYPIVAAIAACGTLATSAVQVGVQFYVRGQVTPMENTDLTDYHADGQPPVEDRIDSPV